MLSLECISFYDAMCERSFSFYASAFICESGERRLSKLT